MADVKVYVCNTCRKMGHDSISEVRDGARLLDALTSEFSNDAAIDIQPVECLSSCDIGCNIAVTGKDRWSYVYGKLDPDVHVEEIANGLRAYAASADGIVPWRERPIIFRKQSIARIPPEGTSS